MTHDEALAKGVALAEWARSFYGDDPADFLAAVNLAAWATTQMDVAEAAEARGAEDEAAMHAAAFIVATGASRESAALVAKYGGVGQRYSAITGTVLAPRGASDEKA